MSSVNMQCPMVDDDNFGDGGGECQGDNAMGQPVDDDEQNWEWLHCSPLPSRRSLLHHKW